MLDGMRANAQSWGVKLAFGIIIIVFVFWGIGSFTGPSGVVATVNGDKITDLEFQRAYARMEENVRESMPGVTREMLRDLGLEQQVLQSLVVRKLLQSEARRIGVEIGPWELRRTVEQLPYFLDRDGRFDRDLYLKAFEGTGRSAAQFEDDLRADMLPGKMESLLTAGAWSSPEAARNIYDFQQEKRTVDYLLFPAEPHMAESVPTEEEIEQAYRDRESLYAVPARVRLEYAELHPSRMGDPASVSDEAVAEAYQARIDQFAEPEKVRARHILIMLPQDASQADVEKAGNEIRAAEARIREGQDFAEVAREVGQDGTAASGGDLGWFSRDQVVPAFAEAAFALQAGEMSGPVRSPFGFHLIRVEERQEATTRALDEVKEELRASLAAEAAASSLAEKADVVLAAALGGEDLAGAAARVKGVEVRDTGLVPAEQLGQTLSLRPADMQAVLSASAGTVLDSALPTPEGMIVVRVAESLPPSTKPLAEVRDELVASLTRDKARGLALADAEKARAAFEGDQPGEALRADVKRSEPFGRDGYVPGLGLGMDLVSAVFAEPAIRDDAGWLSGAYGVDDGAVLARPAESILPGEEAWAAVAGPLRDNMQANRAAMLFQAYLVQLNRDAKVKILNPSLFQPRGATDR